MISQTAVHNAQIDELVAEQDEYQNVFTEHSLQNGGLKNHERLSKSEKVLDPPILTDGKHLKFKDGYIEMKNKLQANTDWYDTDQIIWSCILSQTGGIAHSQLSV